MKEILLTSAVLILVLAAARKLFRGKVSQTLIYGTWLLVALRLLIPVQLFQFEYNIVDAVEPVTQVIDQISDRPVSGPSKEQIYQDIIIDYIEKDQTVFVPEVQEQIKEETAQGGVSKEEILDKIQQARPNQQILRPEVQQQVQQQVEETVTLPTLGQIAGAVWIAGMVIMAVWLALVNLRYGYQLRKHAQVQEEGPVRVLVSENAVSPCLAGLFRPAIYLTPESAEDPQIRRHVLAHERTHLRHGDHVWSLVRCVCLCIYWFNPLVWLAAYLSRRDCELACDEGALKRLGEQERLAYGKSLLDVVSYTTAPVQLIQTATSMNETKKQLKERVNFIVKKPKISLIAAICLVLVCAIVTGCVAAGPTNGEQPGNGTSPSTNSRPTNPTDPTDPTDPIKPTKWVYLVTQVYSAQEGSISDDTDILLYDTDGHLMEYVRFMSGTEWKRFRIEVDEANRTMKAYDEKSILQEMFTYDAAGNLVRWAWYNGGKEDTVSECTYDASGNLLKEVVTYLDWEGDRDKDQIMEWHYTYDADGKLESLYTYEYYFGYLNGSDLSDYETCHYLYSYDELGNITREDQYRPWTGLVSYKTYTYDAQTRTVTETLFDTDDTVQTTIVTFYDAAGKAVYVEEYDAWTSEDRPQITIYTYQAMEVPADFFVPEYISLPKMEPVFGQAGDQDVENTVSEADKALYDHAVAALDTYANTGEVSYTDDSDTYHGQDALWKICELFVRLETYADCAERLQDFYAKDLLVKDIRKYSATCSDYDLETTENDSYLYNAHGLLIKMHTREAYQNLWFTAGTDLTFYYSNGRLDYYTVSPEEGWITNTVTVVYDAQGQHIEDKVTGDLNFTVYYSYDEAGRLFGWYFVDNQDCLTEMKYTYDAQGRLVQTLQSRYLADGMIEGKRNLVETVADDYVYDTDGVLLSVSETVCNFWGEVANSLIQTTIAFTYDDQGRLLTRETKTGPLLDMEGNVLRDDPKDWEEITYCYETYLFYEP